MPEVWPAKFLALISERDRARDVAVALEQENALLADLVRALAHDLRDMHAAEAIDLGAWPAARAVVEYRGAP